MTKDQQAVKNSKERPSIDDHLCLNDYIDSLELYATALEDRLENGIDTGQWV